MDLIDRQVAIEHLKKRLYETEFNSTAEYPYYQEIADNRVDIWMSEVPAVQTDLSEYSDKLWKAAYERGKADAQAERKTGRWIIEPGIGCKCSECDFDIGNDLDFMEYVNFCPYCGADMRGGRDD